MSFKLVQEHFAKMNCPHCSETFTNDSLNLLKEEIDYWVVKVKCTTCKKSAGIAIVGVESENSNKKEDEFNSDLSFNEIEKFSAKPPITSNDVIDAHKFFNSLGSDWTKFVRS